jgi:hypothetical protein
VSDATLRALERRWRESGSVADEAAWLTARSRAGDLAREHLELAAYCGHAAARQAVGEEETIARASYLGDFAAVRVALGEPLESVQDLRAWLRGLVSWGDEVCARAVLAILDVALAQYEPRYGSGPRTYVAPARAWLDEGRAPETRERQRALQDGEELAGVEVGEQAEDALYQTAWSLARVMLVGHFRADVMAAVGMSVANARLEPDAARTHACAALVAWALV